MNNRSSPTQICQWMIWPRNLRKMRSMSCQLRQSSRESQGISSCPIYSLLPKWKARVIQRLQLRKNASRIFQILEKKSHPRALHLIPSRITPLKPLTSAIRARCLPMRRPGQSQQRLPLQWTMLCITPRLLNALVMKPVTRCQQSLETTGMNNSPLLRKSKNTLSQLLLPQRKLKLRLQHQRNRGGAQNFRRLLTMLDRSQYLLRALSIRTVLKKIPAGSQLHPLHLIGRRFPRRMNIMPLTYQSMTLCTGRVFRLLHRPKLKRLIRTSYRSLQP